MYKVVLPAAAILFSPCHSIPALTLAAGAIAPHIGIETTVSELTQEDRENIWKEFVNEDFGCSQEAFFARLDGYKPRSYEEVEADYLARQSNPWVQTLHEFSHNMPGFLHEPSLPYRSSALLATAMFVPRRRQCTTSCGTSNYQSKVIS